MKAVSLKRLATTFPELDGVELIELYHRMRHASTPEAVDGALDYANQKLGADGVESIRDDGWDRFYCDIGLLYVNRGDPYEDTLMYDTRTERFDVGGWGDYIDSSSARRKRFADR